MSKPNDYERPAKRPLNDVSDNESTGNQPIEKSVRREVEVVLLSEEILAIHRKEAKLEKDKQGAIRIAGEAQARVEFLENIIGKKRADSDEEKKRVDELEKKVSDLTEQLETERSAANEAQTKDRARIHELEYKLNSAAAYAKELVNDLRAKIDELTLKLSEATDSEKRLAKEHQEKINCLTKELEEEKSGAKDDRARIDELTLKLSEATDNEKRVEKEHQEKISSLTKQLGEEKSRGKDDRARIDELTRKQAQAAGSVKRLTKDWHEKFDELTRELFTQCEDGQKQPPSKEVNKTGNKSSLGVSSLAKVGGSDHSTNILDVHYTKGPDSVAFWDAFRALCTCAEMMRASYGNKSKARRKRFKEVCKNEKLDCAICEETISSTKILSHFLSAHNSKVEKAGGTAYVSLAALEYWLRKLESITNKPTVEDGDGEDEDGVEEDDEDEEFTDDGSEE